MGGGDMVEGVEEGERGGIIWVESRKNDKIGTRGQVEVVMQQKRDQSTGNQLMLLIFLDLNTEKMFMKDFKRE
jgi:hypothetical protein